MKKLIFITIILVTTHFIFAQSGGNQTYKFLDLTNSARSASLGGQLITINDNDLSLTYHNPAVLDSSMEKSFILNYVNYFAGINYGYVSFANSYKKIGTLATGLHYINYGTFIEANEYGDKTGEFKAAEYAFNIIWANKIDSFLSYGVNFKPIISTLEKYTSFGLALDAGLSYYNPHKLFTASIVAKNLGLQITKYTKETRENLPFELQFGLSKKLAHAPFRFHFVYRHINKWNLRYDKPQSTTLNIFGEEEKTESKLSVLTDNFFRHTIFGVEILPFPNFYLNFGYNHQRRMELSLAQSGAMTGFSWGFGMKISKFHISYARASYHFANASNHFSISSNLNNFYKKSTKNNNNP